MREASCPVWHQAACLSLLVLARPSTVSSSGRPCLHISRHWGENVGAVEAPVCLACSLYIE